MLALLLSSLATFLFGCYAVYLSQKQEETKRELTKEREELARKLYQASILARVSSVIGYSLNPEYIAKIIAETAEELYDVSTTSYTTIKDGKITINTIFKENLTNRYTEDLNRIIIASINNIDETTKSFQVVNNYINDELRNSDIQFDSVVDERKNHDHPFPESAPQSYGRQHKDEGHTFPEGAPQSYFNVPLVVDNDLVGLINISSKKKNIYQDKDMSILYKIVNSATQAVDRLRDVIETEEGRLESLISGISSGVVLFSIDVEGSARQGSEPQAMAGGLKIKNINKSAREFLKLSDNASVNDVFRGFEEFDLPSKLAEVTSDKKSMFFTDVKLHNHFFKIFINPVFSHHDTNLIGATVTLRDITLEKEVESLRQNFMSMVVHELRSPISSIKGASSLLSEKDLSEEDKKKMIGVIKESSETMLNEIGDLLDASKIEAGKFAIDRRESDLNKLIHDRAEAFSPLANAKGLRINLNLEVGISKFDFDRERIAQVINNLISNSIKFTGTGGAITVASASKTPQVIISVSDTGIGMAEDKKGLLFSKFGQTGQIFNKDSTGLGLYISKGIVESHGGKIWIESEEGEGTRVYFTLPMEHESMIQKKVRTENKTEVQAKSLVN